MEIFGPYVAQRTLEIRWEWRHLLNLIRQVEYRSARWKGWM